MNYKRAYKALNRNGTIDVIIKDKVGRSENLSN